MRKYIKTQFVDNFLVKKTTAALVAMVFALIAGGSSSAQDRIEADYSNQQIADFYIEIAFGSEFEFLYSEHFLTSIHKRDHRRVVQLLPLPLPSAPYEEVVSSAQVVANDLKQHMTDGDIEFYMPEQVVEFFSRPQQEYWSEYQDSIVVYVGSHEELVEIIEHEGGGVEQLYQSFSNSLSLGVPLCMGGYISHIDNRQAVGVAKVWIEYSPRLEECLYEEIMQTFGITNDFPAGTPSMFNDDDVFDRPTPLDWMLWRIHMDPRIIAGMNKDEARKTALEILEEIGE